jgi:hypothetical protein
MARRYLMSWQGSRLKRWDKMYNRVRYYVTCAQLNLPKQLWTKEGSREAANRWWIAKRAEVDAAAQQAHPHEQLLNTLDQRHAYAEQHDLPDEAERLAQQRSYYEGDTAGKNIVEASPDDAPGQVLRLLRGPQLRGALPPELLEQIEGAIQERLWQDRFERQPPAPPDKTLGFWADKWITQKTEEVAQKVRRASGLRQMRLGVQLFRDSAGPTLNVAELNADLWERFRLLIRSKVRRRGNPDGWRKGYVTKLFSHAKAFVNWLFEQELLDHLPRNFRKRLPLPRDEPTIRVYSNDDIRTLFMVAAGQHKLHIALGLNCAFHAVDVGSLLRTEVDLGQGRSPAAAPRPARMKTRRRSATRCGL